MRLDEKNIIHTKYGDFIPRYGLKDAVRIKYTDSISFYKNGTIKSICLEEQTDINTPLGVFPAELITFYESGALKRIFPLNGKISGYWTEDDEKNLSLDYQFSFPFGSFCTKIINLNFYESGSLKSVTLWPGETVLLKTGIGKIPVKNGFSLFEDGSIKSLEPAYEIPIKTPIGLINVFDINSLGISGDSNSLCFKQNGDLLSLITSTTKIGVFTKEGALDIIEPVLKPDPLVDGHLTVFPVKITFDGHYVRFDGENKRIYDIYTTRFNIVNYAIPIPSFDNTCGDCSKCNLCQ